MSQIRKFEVSTVVEVTDPATDEERALDDDEIDPLVRAMAVTAAGHVLALWVRGDREFISVLVNEVP